MITIPEYFKQYIDDKIDLNTTNKICCPFHDEDTPSFSYSPTKDVWRCFGACHFGGDVYSLHQKKFNFHSRAEAINDLNKRLGITDVEASEEINYQVKSTHDSKIANRIIELNYLLKLAFRDKDINKICDLMQEITKYE